MFRYIALAWDPAAQDTAQFAGALVQAMQAEPAWNQDLAHPRLCVFSTGTIQGINQAYPLHGRSGAVLGHLFRRGKPQTTTDRISKALSESPDVAASGGRELVEKYWGRYVAFFESGDGSMQVLRDPSGNLPCYRRSHQGVTIVFSWLQDVLDVLASVPVPDLDRQGLAAAMAFGELTGRRTALKGVTQVLAGERVNLGADEKGEFLWDASALSCTPADLQAADAAAALRETVTACVWAWARCYDSILLRLSGGLDSSIVASCLTASRTPARVTCLNYHSLGADSDERPYARLAAAAAGRDLIECERNAAFRLERVLDVARTPMPHHYVGRLTSSTDASIAEHVGARAMFTGAGGDQLFFEIPQWWPAADYLRLRGIDRGLFAAALDAARLGRTSIWGVMRRAIADRFRSLPPALDLHRHRSLISQDVRQQADQPVGFVHPVLTERSKLPIGKLKQVQQLAYLPGYYDPYARERAPELVCPLLSQPIVELCLSLPTYQLTQGGRGRALARTAFQAEIPTPIARRRSKGGMGQHFDAVLAANLGFARQILLDGELVRLGLLDRAAVEQALAGDLGSQAGEVHLAISTEAWLQRTKSLR